MIKFGITLSVFAISLAAAGITSFFYPLSVPWAVTDHGAMALHFYDGRVRVFWITAEKERILVMPAPLGRADLWVQKQGRGIEDLRALHLFPIQIGNRRAVDALGGQWRQAVAIPTRMRGSVEVSYLRLPTWLPVVLLLVQPVRAIIFGPWLRRRRERRNLCLTCGYERVGLTEPRCPECGTPHEPDPCAVENRRR